MGEKKVVKTTCRMCGTLCGIDAHIEDNKVVHIEGNKDSVLNKGRICIKGSSAVTWLNHQDRLMKPLKKNENGEFEEIELEQAMDEIAEKLLNIQKKYGDNAIGVWKGEGIDFAQQEELARRWIHAVGSPNYFSNDTQCFASRYLSFNLVYGCWPQADYENSKMIINWGTNAPLSHSYWMQQINMGREKGATLVVIDTRYTEIARQADIFIKIKPGTDSALAWGIIREMIRRDEIDHEFIENFTVGFPELKEYAQEFTFERVEEITGVEGKYITMMVDAIAKARPCVSSWAGTGLEHQSNGVNSIRAVTMIDAIAGATDRKGGMKTPSGFGMRGLTIYDEKPLLELKPIGAEKYPVLYERRQECHTLMLMDQILSSKPYPFKGLVMTAANPVLTNANSNKVEAALSELDLLVVKDLFMTETAKFADYILPAASYLEREEVFCNSAKQAAFITGKHIDNGLQTEYELFKGLAERMNAGDYFPWKDDHELTEWLLEPTGYTVADLKTNPSGFIFGEYEYEKHIRKAANGEKPFNTPTGKVELFSQYLVDKGIEGLDGVPEYHAPAYVKNNEKEYPYLLMTGARKQKYFHGRYRNIPQLYKSEPHGALEIHPEDAKELGVKNGDRVRVTSRIGSVDTYVEVVHKKEIYKGAVQHTHGFVNENINRVTYDDVTDSISGFPSLKAVQVKIEKI
ncbi:MAG: molybdopterin-dependent oxidoreductase [Anaeromicrobium sp.]|jgi:anaerobic selenocysteine-containing dehydrogenase|uniref:molybdopterin-containing oxidoreductase family protein n=1 Tax=Anaeromicrobium sp. TaxID=1929132 RepID=UPI0025F8DE51|nr:molybdopterin-dependent oxidoreductase [Anaeromicrobium sp.]MCT4593422.1 molybdopterin-dependent oxidoreductase [Anaeromicrobium sp.]